MTNALKVKKAIVQQLRSQPALKTCQVEISHPGSEMDPHGCIFINTLRCSERARSLGKSHRREELTVELALVSQSLTTDLVESEERAWALLAWVEEAIASDSSLGGLVISAEVVSFDQRSFNGPERNVIEITCEIKVLADKDLEA